MRFVVVLAVLFTMSQVAHAKCARGGLLFQIQTNRIGEDVLTESIEIRTTGAWKVHDGADVAQGCLSAKRLALVKRAVRAAKFQNIEAGQCDAVSTMHVSYAGANG